MSGLMCTSSHSESENHMFQQLMSNSSTLVEFIIFFETAMQIQRQVQSKNDHDSRYTIPKVVTDYEIEQHAVQLYTRKIFGEVQGQIKAASRYCMNYQVDHKNGFTEYTVMDRSVRNNGLANNLDKAGNPLAFDEYIPAVSVCIDAITLKDPNTYFDSNQVGSSGEFGVQMKEIYEMTDHAIGLYKDDPEKLSSLKDTIRGLKDKAVEQMGNDHTLSKDEFIEGLVGIPKPDKVSVYCPNNLRSKGCGKRITNVREEAIKQQTVNHRTCSFCNEVGHNSRGCKVRKQKILEKKN
ncbi:uncharacterized protein [Rutidosis leptorrhynchoides]|uniref:uncharacterized protein n=1 Tax=Rutidosis leptorrhynchoides TaxID=125765 RepID=UPI003A9925DA